MIIGAKSGAHVGRSAVMGSKGTNAHSVIGAKGGAAAHVTRVVSAMANAGMGDLGGGKSAPGNTRNAVGSGQRDGPQRPEGVKSMADPRPSKRYKSTESSKKNKAD